MRDIADVTKPWPPAISPRSPVNMKGEILELKNTVNTMVNRCSSSRRRSDPRGPRSGLEGKLGGQANIDIAGTWKDLTDSVNSMAGNFVEGQVRDLAEVAGLDKLNTRPHASSPRSRAAVSSQCSSITRRARSGRPRTTAVTRLAC